MAGRGRRCYRRRLRAPADVLLAARKKDSLAKRSRVLAVINEMKAQDEPITFLGVAGLRTTLRQMTRQQNSQH